MSQLKETADPSSLVEAHKGSDPRIVLFYPLLVALLAVLAGGLFYQQLLNTDIHQDRERVQNQRRILVPGPRGNIYDRDGRLLVGSRPRFSVVIYLDELRAEFRREYIQIRKNYRAAGDKDMPTSSQMEQIARATVVQRYLDQINLVLGRDEKVDMRDLRRHFERELLLPYTLIDGLEPAEYARLLERLPVRSPVQVYTSSTRYYPYGSAASHTLGFVGTNPNLNAEDFPGEDLTTFKMKGAIGRDGLEQSFDEQLHGEAGGTIFRVDPSGYKVNPPIERRLPVQGHTLTTSLDIDLQLAAENAIAPPGQTPMTGAAVAIDVNTGEVLVIASKPDYNLSDFSPRLSHATATDINDRGAWLNRAVNGLYPPGSTFKLVTAIAGLRQGTITPQSDVDCTGYYKVGGRLFICHGGHGHGELDFEGAIAQSCNTFFYKYGIDTGVDAIAAQAARFHLTEPTGIELPHETKNMLVGDPEWKRRERDSPWFPGDTANLSIGQGYIQVTPLQMACFTASLARGQTFTRPTLVHQPNRPAQHTEPLAITVDQYRAILEGMEQCTTVGTAKLLQLPALRIPDLRIAGKTGTAQVRKAHGTIELAWFVCFAPIERPEIAIAVVMEGDTPDESYVGGRYAAPVAQAILKKYFEKKRVQPVAALFK